MALSGQSPMTPVVLPQSSLVSPFGMGQLECHRTPHSSFLPETPYIILKKTTLALGTSPHMP